MEKYRSIKEHRKAAIEYAYEKTEVKEVVFTDAKRFALVLIAYLISLAIYSELNFINIYYNYADFVTLHIAITAIAMMYVIKQGDNELALKHGKKLSEQAKRKISEEKRVLNNAKNMMFIVSPIVFLAVKLVGIYLAVSLLPMMVVTHYLLTMWLINKKYKKEEQSNIIDKIKENMFFARELKILNHYIRLRNQVEDDVVTRMILIEDVSRIEEIIAIFLETDNRTKVETFDKIREAILVVSERMKKDLPLDSKETYNTEAIIRKTNEIKEMI